MEYMGFNKFKDVDKNFHKNTETLIQPPVTPLEVIHQFPVYVGHVNLARYLFFYDLYKQCYKLSGHLADIGTWKGASFLFMTKMVKLFEPYASTQVHGFDWFKGMNPDPKQDDVLQAGKYNCNYETLVEQIHLQELQDIAIIHKMDISTELDQFFAKHSYLRFKMVFIDCGIARVLEKSLGHFWPRLVYGGILVVDHYNVDSSPSESDLVEKYTGKNQVRHLPFSRQPTGYIIKQH